MPDLPAFLQQNWAVALYHDRFSEFQAALRLELESDADMQALLDGARDADRARPASRARASFAHHAKAEPRFSATNTNAQ